MLSFQTIAGSEWTKLFAFVAVTASSRASTPSSTPMAAKSTLLSRAGYFPQWLSVTSSRHKTPVRALVSGSALGMAAALGIYFRTEQPGYAILLNMAVFGAVIAYICRWLRFCCCVERT